MKNKPLTAENAENLKDVGLAVPAGNFPGPEGRLKIAQRFIAGLPNAKTLSAP